MATLRKTPISLNGQPAQKGKSDRALAAVSLFADHCSPKPEIAPREHRLARSGHMLGAAQIVPLLVRWIEQEPINRLDPLKAHDELPAASLLDEGDQLFA